MLESTEKRKEGKPETAAGGKTFGSKRPAAEITSGSSMEGNDREPLELGYDEPVGQIGGQPARRCAAAESETWEELERMRVRMLIAGGDYLGQRDEDYALDPVRWSDYMEVVEYMCRLADCCGGEVLPMPVIPRTGMAGFCVRGLEDIHLDELGILQCMHVLRQCGSLSLLSEEDGRLVIMAVVNDVYFKKDCAEL